jgi:hypothetical protein
MSTKDKFMQLSALSKSLVNVNPDYGKVNDLLIEFYLEDLPEGTELKPFNKWKEEGYHIKKGSTGYLIWGKPRKKEDMKELAENGEPKMFPICYLFSSLQVEKQEKKELSTV